VTVIVAAVAIVVAIRTIDARHMGLHDVTVGDQEDHANCAWES
jgi:hypothetical protein